MDSSRVLLRSPSASSRQLLERGALAGHASQLTDQSENRFSRTRLEGLSRRQHELVLVLAVRGSFLLLLVVNAIEIGISWRDFEVWPPRRSGKGVELVFLAILLFACTLSLVNAIGLTVRKTSGRLSPQAKIAHVVVLCWFFTTFFYLVDFYVASGKATTPTGSESEDQRCQALFPSDIWTWFKFGTWWYRLAFNMEFWSGQLIWLVGVLFLHSPRHSCLRLCWSFLVCLLSFLLSLLLLLPEEGLLGLTFPLLGFCWEHYLCLGYASRVLIPLGWLLHWDGPGNSSKAGTCCCRRPGMSAKHALQRLLLAGVLDKRSLVLAFALPFGFPFVPFGPSITFWRGLLAVLVAYLLCPMDDEEVTHSRLAALDAEEPECFDTGRALRLLDFTNETYLSPEEAAAISLNPSSWRTFHRRLDDAETDTHCLIVEEAGELAAEYKLRGEKAPVSRGPGSIGSANPDTPRRTATNLMPQESCLVVAFRGTASWRNVNTDLQMFKPGTVARGGRARYLEDTLLFRRSSQQSPSMTPANSQTMPPMHVGSGIVPIHSASQGEGSDSAEMPTAATSGSQRRVRLEFPMPTAALASDLSDPPPVARAGRYQSDPGVLMRIRMSVGRLSSGLWSGGPRNLNQGFDPLEDVEHAFDLIGLAHCLEEEINLASSGRRGINGHDAELPLGMAMREQVSARAEVSGRCRRGISHCLVAFLTFVLRCFCLPLPARLEAPSLIEPQDLFDGGLGLARAHRGFLAGYLSIRRELLALVQRRLTEAQRERRRLQIYVTGHSLGGALASLALLDLRVTLKDVLRSGFGSEISASPSVVSARSGGRCWARHPHPTGSLSSMPSPSHASSSRSPSKRNLPPPPPDPPTLACYTYGAPRPGNSAFRTLFNVLAPPETYRLVVKQDVITACPPTSLGFRQVGREVWLDDGSDPVFCMSWSMRQLLPARTRLRDHRLKEYFALMTALLKKERASSSSSSNSNVCKCYASPWASDPIFDDLRAQGLLLSA